MGESTGIGRGGSPGGARRVAGVAMFEDAPAEEALGRKQPQGSTFASMAFADVEKENQVCMLETPQHVWARYKAVTACSWPATRPRSDSCAEPVTSARISCCHKGQECLQLEHIWLPILS